MMLAKPLELQEGGGYNTADPLVWSAANGIQKLTGFDGINGHAYGINSSGQVVGRKGTATRSVAFVWSPSVGQTDLPDIPGTSSSEAFAINDSGVVVGRASIAPDDHS